MEVGFFVGWLLKVPATCWLVYLREWKWAGRGGRGGGGGGGLDDGGWTGCYAGWWPGGGEGEIGETTGWRRAGGGGEGGSHLEPESNRQKTNQHQPS